MFGLPLWSLCALVNVVAVLWWATSFLEELQVTDAPHRLGTPLVRLLAVLVALCFGVLVVVTVTIATLLFRRSLATHRAAARAARERAERIVPARAWDFQ